MKFPKWCDHCLSQGICSSLSVSRALRNLSELQMPNGSKSSCWVEFFYREVFYRITPRVDIKKSEEIYFE
jgi:hypothetical protein